jgi:hypothetical protein
MHADPIPKATISVMLGKVRDDIVSPKPRLANRINPESELFLQKSDVAFTSGGEEHPSSFPPTGAQGAGARQGVVTRSLSGKRRPGPLHAGLLS